MAGVAAWVESVWQRLLAVGPPPAPSIVLFAAALALFAVLYLPVWRVVRHVSTMAHEGGHGAVAALVGRRFLGIELRRDTSGASYSSGAHGIGRVAELMAGYVAPPVLGLGLIQLIMGGHVAGALWGSLLLLALGFLVTRNPFGSLLMVVTAIVVGAFIRYGSPTVQGAFLAALCWFLLISAVRNVIDLQRMRRSGRAVLSDADQLADLTGVPGIGWVGLFAAADAAMLCVGAYWLLR
ncbi:MAG TPA: M50 family metallopeptidase [Candidatus Dormibacteraeota bacterium]|jgi:hypothetical protein|nr:M50 family metallopeptidase [Candidatus Dormibacteraeota bacterium]